MHFFLLFGLFVILKCCMLTLLQLIFLDIGSFSLVVGFACGFFNVLFAQIMYRRYAYAAHTLCFVPLEEKGLL